MDKRDVMLETEDTTDGDPTKTCLWIAHTFPPIAAVGIYRTLRFVEDLPHFGWEGIVLTVKEDAVVGHPVDHVLSQRVLPETVVRRAGTWRLLDRCVEMVKWLWGRTNASKRTGSDQTETEHRRFNTSSRSVLRRMRNGMCAVRDVVLCTPDNCSNWIGPAFFVGCRMIVRYRPQIIFSTGPPHSAHLVGLAIHLIMRIPWVLDLRDPWATDEWSIQESSKAQNWLQTQLERLCVRCASRVILNTARLKQDFISAYPQRVVHKFVVIPNGVDPSSVRPIRRYLREAGETQKTEVPILCHPGSIYRHRRLEPICQAMQQLKDSGERVLLEQIGDVSNATELTDLLDQWDLSEVSLLSHQSHDAVLRRMALVDILVIIEPVATLKVPAKFYEMLLFRKPMLVLTGEGALADVMREFGIGMIANPDDPGEIAEAIRRILQSLRGGVSEGDWDRALAAYDSRRLTEELAEVFTTVTRHK